MAFDRREPATAQRRTATERVRQIQSQCSFGAVCVFVSISWQLQLTAVDLLFSSFSRLQSRHLHLHKDCGAAVMVFSTPPFFLIS